MRPADIVFAIAMIFQIQNSSVIGTGTGFFMANSDNEKFFITNRHMVQDENGNKYSSLVIKLHSDSSDLTQLVDVEIPLQPEGDRIPYYQYYENIDIVAIPLEGIDLKNALIKYVSEDHCPPPYANFEYGTKLNVIGFPLGFTDPAKYFPILKSTIVSTPPSESFGEYFSFLMDGNLKRGMSGSPVFTELSPIYYNSENDRIMAIRGEPKMFFVGIHSASYTKQVGERYEPSYAYRDGNIIIESLSVAPITENLELHSCYFSEMIFRLINADF